MALGNVKYLAGLETVAICKLVQHGVIIGRVIARYMANLYIK